MNSTSSLIDEQVAATVVAIAEAIEAISSSINKKESEKGGLVEEELVLVTLIRLHECTSNHTVVLHMNLTSVLI